MSDLFGNLERQANERTAKVGGNRARIAAVQRATRQFGKYVAKAATVEDREARIDYAKPEILASVKDACAEHGFEGKENVQSVLNEVMAALRTSAGDWELIDKTDNDHHDTGSKEEMIEMARERNAEEGGDNWVAKPAGFSAKNFKGAATKVADGATPPDGDTYTQERVDVSKDTLPTTDTSRVPASGVPEIKVPSKRNPTERQDISGPQASDAERGKSDHAESQVAKTVDADSPIQGEHGDGGPTKTFITPEGQGSAVTSSWRVE